VLHPLFTQPVAPGDPSRTDEYIGAEISDSWIVRQAGGLACWWLSDEATISSEGAYDSQYATVYLLPANATDFAAFSAAEAAGTDHRTACSYGFCQYDKLTSNGWWLSIVANGLPSASDAATTALANPVFAAITATVAALPAPTTPWTPPAPALTVPASCTGVISGADLSSALGVSGASTVDPTWNQPSVTATALAKAGGSSCLWTIPDGTYGDTVEIAVLPGGEWAQTAGVAAANSLAAAYGGTPLATPAIAGVAAGKTAEFDHVDSAALDIVIGGTWFKISRGNGPAVHGLDNLGVLKAIATRLAALHHL